MVRGKSHDHEEDHFCEGERHDRVVCSSEERATIHEGGNPLPPQPSCGGLKKVVMRRSSKT
jgi:hypothetical protein